MIKNIILALLGYSVLKEGVKHHFASGYEALDEAGKEKVNRVFEMMNK